MVLLTLAGCAAAPPMATPARFVPDDQGLGVAGSPLRVDFGRAPDGVIAALSREIGPPRALDTLACPASIARQLRWAGLDLTFSDEQFVGWRQGAAQAGQTCGL